MTSSTYKGNLSVGGSALEKSKLQLRRPTPDSDVLASSDDDREHVAPVARPAGGHPGGRRPSSGWLQDIQPNRKFSLPSVSFAGSQPTTPSLELPIHSRPGTSAFPWNTSSFSSAQANSRLKEVLPSPTSAHFPSENPLPSPAAPESEEGIGFLLNQQNPIRKAVRSQSYSIGQGDLDSSPVGQFSSRVRSTAGVRHRPSKPSLLGDSGVGLSQLREDDIDEVDSNSSDHGIRLPQGYWEREQKQALLKQAAVESARARNRATTTTSPVYQHPPPPQRRQTTAGLRGMASYTDNAIEEHEAHEGIPQAKPSSLTRRFSENVSVFREPEREREREAAPTLLHTKSSGSTSNMMTQSMNTGRRHSFAHYAGFKQNMPLSTPLSNTQEEDESLMSPRQASHSAEDQGEFDASSYFTGFGPAARTINTSAISAAHPDPVVARPANNGSNPYSVPPVLGRQGRRLFVVSFKCSRADIYYLYDNTGLEIRPGDLVICEGDRGHDLGQVTHADVSMEDARKYKVLANEEHFRWLVMFSQYSLAGAQNESGMLGALARANGLTNNPKDQQMDVPLIGNSGDPDARPKMIKRLAQQHEILALRDKEGAEAKAKRLGATKAADHKLPMEVLDAEYQADYHKLTYYYYADSYVNFNELVTDLFKQYKVRIWMSAVNPASVVNPATPNAMRIPPPSAIGPGAIIKPGSGNSSLPVGPGFGAGYQSTNRQYSRNRNTAAQTNYDDGHHAFAHQLPAYDPQGTYGMPPWAQSQHFTPQSQQFTPQSQQFTPQGQQFTPQGQQFTPQMYGNYGAFAGGYPNTSTSASPMNYGAYYPPGSGYGPSSAYNRGYQVPYSHTPGGNTSQQAAPGASNGKPGGGGPAGQKNATKNGNNAVATTGKQDLSSIEADMQRLRVATPPTGTPNPPIHKKQA